MYIHFSIYQLIAPLGSLYVLVPEKLIDNLSAISELKHRKQLFLIQQKEYLDNKIFLIGQDSKIYDASKFLYFEFPAQNINITPLLDREGAISLNLFFNLFGMIDMKKTQITNVEFNFFGIANHRLDFNASDFVSNDLNYIQVLIDEPNAMINLYLYGAKLHSVSQDSEYEFIKDIYSVSEFKNEFPEVFEKMILENYILFM